MAVKPKRFLDGPKFVAWLEEEGVTSDMLDKSEQSMLLKWREGRRADIYAKVVDRLLARYCLPASYIPDEVWSKDQFQNVKPREKRTVRRFSAAKRQEAVELLEGGLRPKFVSDLLGVPQSTLRTWKERGEKEVNA